MNINGKLKINNLGAIKKDKGNIITVQIGFKKLEEIKNMLSVPLSEVFVTYCYITNHPKI